MVQSCIYTTLWGTHRHASFVMCIQCERWTSLDLIIVTSTSWNWRWYPQNVTYILASELFNSIVPMCMRYKHHLYTCSELPLKKIELYHFLLCLFVSSYNYPSLLSQHHCKKTSTILIHLSISSFNISKTKLNQTTYIYLSFYLNTTDSSILIHLSFSSFNTSETKLNQTTYICLSSSLNTIETKFHQSSYIYLSVFFFQHH